MNRRFDKFTFFTGRGKLNLRQARKDVEKELSQRRRLKKLRKKLDNISLNKEMNKKLDFREDIMKFSDNDLDSLIDKLLEEE